MSNTLQTLDNTNDSKIITSSIDSDIIKYIPRTSFNGKKDGYVFKNGSKGIGYYYDPIQIKEQQSSKDLSNKRSRENENG